MDEELPSTGINSAGGCFPLNNAAQPIALIRQMYNSSNTADSFNSKDTNQQWDAMFSF